jgi:predicted dehydrogenase
VRVGIIGYGVVGKTRHHSILKNTSFRVTSISENNSQARDEIPDNMEVFEDYKALIEHANIDIVFISLPNKFAASATKLSLEKGLHVFCEKPPAKTLAELEEVFLVSQTYPNLKLMYGFNHRFHHSVEQAKLIIQDNSLGRLINMRGVYGKSQMISFNQSDWRTKREESGGGILLDQGIHMLDLMKYLSGEDFTLLLIMHFGTLMSKIMHMF